MENYHKKWVVELNGHMTYFVNGKICFEIEPETLTCEDRLYELMCHNLIDVEDYTYNYVIACRNAGLARITLRLK